MNGLLEREAGLDRRHPAWEVEATLKIQNQASVNRAIWEPTQPVLTQLPPSQPQDKWSIPSPSSPRNPSTRPSQEGEAMHCNSINRELLSRDDCRVVV